MLEVVYAYLRKTRTVTVYGNFGGIPLRAIMWALKRLDFILPKGSWWKRRKFSSSGKMLLRAMVHHSGRTQK
jgi:hypothetical protein